MEAWEEAIVQHEKECAERYQGIEKQFGEVKAQISGLNGKFTVLLWMNGYMVALLSAITLRVFFV